MARESKAHTLPSQKYHAIDRIHTRMLAYNRATSIQVKFSRVFKKLKKNYFQKMKYRARSVYKCYSAMKIQALIILFLTTMPSLSAENEVSKAEQVFRRLFNLGNEGISIVDLGIMGPIKSEPIEIEEGMELKAKIDMHSLFIFNVVQKSDSSVNFEYKEIIDNRSSGGEYTDNAGNFTVEY